MQQRKPRGRSFRTWRCVVCIPLGVVMLVGASIIVTPIWLATGFNLAGHGRAVLLGLAVAVLSSALPYLLEFMAIRKVRAATYGVLLSIEPAIAALMGFAILSQGLTVLEMVGIAAITVAAAGASWLSGSTSAPSWAKPSAAKRFGED